nr:putative reverse transcriptase domain-containing protein [Tanacetum cinerariifolium]
IEAVKNWKIPKTLSEIRLFLGLRWIKLFSDYDCEICYHPEKANVVADALSRKEKPRMKKDIATYDSDCLTCLKIKAETSKTFGFVTAARDTYVVAGIGNTVRYETHEQSECTSQTLENMLRASVIDFGVLIKERLKAAKDRQKSYVDNRRKPLEFEVGDQVLLKVSPWKGLVRVGNKNKLAPRYVGPFEIIERIGHVAYRLRFPQELSSLHDTFHVSNLKKYLANANLYVSFEEIKVDKTLRLVEEPAKIMDREVKWLKHSSILILKSRPNGKLIHKSILNGPYVRKMIPEPGDANRDITVTETFHLQTDDELSDKELKQIEADDQPIQTILLGLPEDIYAAVDSCETTQEIWLRVQQMMKGSLTIIIS